MGRDSLHLHIDTLHVDVSNLKCHTFIIPCSHLSEQGRMQDVIAKAACGTGLVVDNVSTGHMHQLVG